MSCEECDKAQADPLWVMPIRIETANLLVIGCRKHCKVLLDRLDLLHNLTNYLRESRGIPPEEREEIRKRFGIFLKE